MAVAPPSTWQQDLESNLDYYYRFFRYRFRFLHADLQEEQTQEAVCQVALTYASEWRRHGKRVQDRFSIARCILTRVKRGRSCTRGCKNADTLDRTYRKSGPKREQCRRTVAQALQSARARPELPVELRLDLETWYRRLHPDDRELVDAFIRSTPSQVARDYGVSLGTAQRWRKALGDFFLGV